MVGLALLSWCLYKEAMVPLTLQGDRMCSALIKGRVSRRFISKCCTSCPTREFLRRCRKDGAGVVEQEGESAGLCPCCESVVEVDREGDMVRGGVPT